MTEPHRSPLLDHGLALSRIYAIRFAKRLATGVDIEDLIAIGNVAVAELLARGTDAERFEPLAINRIKWAMLDELRARDMLSRDERRLAKRVHAAKATLTAELQHPPDVSTVAKRLGVEETVVHGAFTSVERRRASDVFFEEVEGDGGPSDWPLLPHQARKLFAALSPRAREVLELRFIDEWTMLAIGRRIGVSEARVTQLVSDAIRELRLMLVEPEAVRETPALSARTGERSRRCRACGHAFEPPQHNSFYCSHACRAGDRCPPPRRRSRAKRSPSAQATSPADQTK